MNFIIIHSTGKKQYTTSAEAYKIIKNQPVYIGSASNLPESGVADYLTQCLRNSGEKTAKIDRIINGYKNGQNNIFKL